MGKFDGMVAAGLHKNENGELRFYPYRKWGKAYKVESEEQSKSIKQKFKKFYSTLGLMSFILFILMYLFAGDNILYNALFLIAFFIVYYSHYGFTVRTITRHLVPTGESLSRAAQRHAVAAGVGVRTLTFYLIFSLVSIPVGILLYSPEYPYAAWLLIGLGCVLSVGCFLYLRIALKAKRGEDTAA